MSDRIPKCESCGVKHPWLLGVNEIATRVSWQCNECGWHQTTEMPVNPRVGAPECVECDSQAIARLDGELYCQLHASTLDAELGELYEPESDGMPDDPGSTVSGPSLFGCIVSRISRAVDTGRHDGGGDAP